MKRFNWFRVGTLALALACSVVGCKRKNVGVTPLGDSAAGVAGGNRTLDDGLTFRPPEEVGFGGGELANFNPDDFNQDRAALAEHTVYFDYDSSGVQSSEQSKVQAVAAALRSDPTARLLVEGHCDERGTEEYNRSLGERRALAVREALVMAGVDSNRVATRSYGEDRPADPGHNEAAWRQNRRGEFVLLHPR